MKKIKGNMKKEDKGMTIAEVAHYFKTPMYYEQNLIRVHLHNDGYYYWNPVTGQCVKAKDLNRGLGRKDIDAQIMKLIHR